MDLAVSSNPSSSGPFTHIALPSNWEAYPFTPTSALGPIVDAAAALEFFYEKMLEECGRMFWSDAPSQVGFKWSLGVFTIIVQGQQKRGGLPWGVFALLIQGMLERAKSAPVAGDQCGPTNKIPSDPQDTCTTPPSTSLTPSAYSIIFIDPPTSSRVFNAMIDAAMGNSVADGATINLASNPVMQPGQALALPGGSGTALSELLGSPALVRKMPSANGTITNGAVAERQSNVQSKLILCFDGTGNQFKADPSDTNIVKLYQKFDRETPNQFHYYQPGIGTYKAGDHSVNTGLWGKIKRWFSQTIDAGVGTSFDQHVIAGYRFAMRYHEDGNKIYMFGFSRGAFTARFLARMIATVGLLSKGNEEMVPFAYRTYQEYVMGDRFEKKEDAQKYMNKFKTTFCRGSATVHFLGLFDTVNSVSYFDNPFTKKKYLPSVLQTAKHVRHAVAIDERRCKFKAALLSQDINEDDAEDIKEVFFAGNHGDVGGGWAPKERPGESESKDPLQLSDLALEWMIGELEALPKEDHPAWNNHKDIFVDNLRRQTPSAAVRAPMHDILRYGGGELWVKTFLWRIMGAYLLHLISQSTTWSLTASSSEYIPFFSRLELKGKEWKSQVFPPNMCDTRDIPEGATFHESVKQRMQNTELDYHPKNLGAPNVRKSNFVRGHIDKLIEDDG
ncbi:MAG: hypothetical protein Q9218_003605 [Villophora microphyllina]